jgi:hypothetical protein
VITISEDDEALAAQLTSADLERWPCSDFAGWWNALQRMALQRADRD